MLLGGPDGGDDSYPGGLAGDYGYPTAVNVSANNLVSEHALLNSMGLNSGAQG